MNNTTTKTKQTIDVRKLVFTALLSAMAVVLMKFLAFKIPIMPGFISFDFSDVPAVLASLTMGPVSGVAVCLIKNLGGFLLAGSMTGGVGEVSNFILGCLLVIPAGLIANRTGHSMKHVVLACLAGAVSMGAGRRCDQLFHRISAVHRSYADGSHHRNVSGDMVGR